MLGATSLHVEPKAVKRRLADESLRTPIAGSLQSLRRLYRMLSIIGCRLRGFSDRTGAVKP